MSKPHPTTAAASALVASNRQPSSGRNTRCCYMYVCCAVVSNAQGLHPKTRFVLFLASWLELAVELFELRLQQLRSATLSVLYTHPADDPASGVSLVRKPSISRHLATPRWYGNKSPPGKAKRYRYVSGVECQGSGNLPRCTLPQSRQTSWSDATTLYYYESCREPSQRGPMHQTWSEAEPNLA